MLIGYARVSTDDQNLDLQRDALRLAGCEKIYEDRMSGAKAARPGLTVALEVARTGDVLTVWRLDRLGRSLHDLILQSSKPVIVAGDFNTFWGTHEIYLFMRAAGLRSANSAGLPSFPAKVPRVELDFILVSEGIEVTDFRVPDVRFSDHRPLVCDFHVPADAAARRSAA